MPLELGRDSETKEGLDIGSSLFNLEQGLTSDRTSSSSVRSCGA